MIASENPTPDVVKEFLVNGAKIEAEDSSGLRALHYASQQGRVENMEILVKGPFK